MPVGGSFDYGGFFVAFVVCGAVAMYSIFGYVRELRGTRRPQEMFRWRTAIIGTFTSTLITGLRRFVLHQ